MQDIQQDVSIVMLQGAAVAAQAHALVEAPNASDVPISHSPQQPPQQLQQQPQELSANGLHQQQAAPAQQQPQQQQLQQAPQQQAPQQQAPQHVPQHDSIAPGPQGLGGVPVQPPPRQPSFADSASTAPTGANTWGPPQKPAAQAAPGPNLGSSLMASLSGGGGGLPQASPPLSDPAIVSHSLGGSGSLGGLTGGPPEGPKAPVILPPSAQQVPS